MMEETWKAVIGYEKLYEVSDMGRVRSLNYSRTGRVQVLKNGVDSNGYLYVNLCKVGSGVPKTIHSLVAKSFIDPNYREKGLVVNHKDFNKQNNILSNLEIVTQRENSNMKHIPSISKYTGVYLKRRSWQSSITINGKLLYLGTFNTELEASEYYEAALNCVKEGRTKDIVVKRIIERPNTKGYCFHKASKKWVAYVWENGKRKHLGLFKTEEEAILVSQEAKSKIRTIQNTSNASSHIDVLKEESKEMVEISKDGVIENNVKTFVCDEDSLFVVKVSDLYSEWEFGLPIGDNHCINDIVKAIEATFNVDRNYEKLISPINGKKV